MIKPTIRRARAWLVMCTFAAACSGNETVDTAAMTGTSGMMSTTGTGGGSEPTLHFSLYADSEAMELIEMPCASTGSWLGGPLGPASAVGAEKGAFGSTCAPNGYPPAAPLCACGPVACAAG